ncbi:MAG: hypothetical protein PHQ23_00520 [Candidatus Wallbacteria bacterium]|nr:hypothetical protein [Candidatus Wallbacteria bacterium]
MERELVNFGYLALLALTFFTAGYRIRENPKQQWDAFLEFLSNKDRFEQTLYGEGTRVVRKQADQAESLIKPELLKKKDHQ